MSRTPDRNREYMREYMRARRARVNTSSSHGASIVNTLAGTDVNTSSPHGASIVNTLADAREYYEERAAVLEYDHGMSREGAEAEARRRTIEKFGVAPMTMISSIYGRVGRDPKPGTTKAGKPMCTASVAVDVGKEPGQETLWVSVMAFGGLAETLGHHQSGDMLAVTGRLTRGRYTGTDGQERESWTLLADAMHSSRTVRPGQQRKAEEPEGKRAKRTTTPKAEDWRVYGTPGDEPPMDAPIPF